MNSGLVLLIISIIFIVGVMWLIRASKRFASTQAPEKKVKDPFKGRDLKKYMRAEHGY